MPLGYLITNETLGMEGEFKRYALGTSLDHLQQPYDYDSIMHYHSNSFAKDPSQPTITPKVKLPKGVVLGQRDHLSQIDIKMIQALYGCQSNGWYLFNFLRVLFSCFRDNVFPIAGLFILTNGMGHVKVYFTR